MYSQGPPAGQQNTWTREAVCVRKPWRYGSLCGTVAIGVGVVILLAMVLPAAFWWFLAGIALIAGGICLSRWRC